MAKAIIRAGICGFDTEITAESDDMMTAVLHISSECPAYESLKNQPFEVDAVANCFSKVGLNEVYGLFRDTCKHAACPVPAGALKAVEVACGFALPSDANIKLSK